MSSSYRSLTLLIFTLLCGCNSDIEVNRTPYLTVDAHTATWQIPPTAFGSGGLAQPTAGLADDYQRNGNGPVYAAVTAPSPALAAAWVAALQAKLTSDGIPPNMLVTTPLATDAMPAGATLSYRSIAMVLPPCANVPSEEEFTEGCAIDRNLGQMAARPSDLMGHDGVGPRDGARVVETVKAYQTDTFAKSTSLLDSLSTTGSSSN